LFYYWFDNNIRNSKSLITILYQGNNLGTNWVYPHLYISEIIIIYVLLYNPIIVIHTITLSCTRSQEICAIRFNHIARYCMRIIPIIKLTKKTIVNILLLNLKYYKSINCVRNKWAMSSILIYVLENQRNVKKLLLSLLY